MESARPHSCTMFVQSADGSVQYLLRALRTVGLKVYGLQIVSRLSVEVRAQESWTLDPNSR